MKISLHRSKKIAFPWGPCNSLPLKHCWQAWEMICKQGRSQGRASWITALTLPCVARGKRHPLLCTFHCPASQWTRQLDRSTCHFPTSSHTVWWTTLPFSYAWTKWTRYPSASLQRHLALFADWIWNLNSLVKWAGFHASFHSWGIILSAKMDFNQKELQVLSRRKWNNGKEIRHLWV